MWVTDNFGYMRIDSHVSPFAIDDLGFIRLDATAGAKTCTPGKTVPCGNVCRAPANCKKGKPGQERVQAIGKENLKEFAMAERAKRIAKAQGKAPTKEAIAPTATRTTSARKAAPKRTASLKDVRENKLSKAEQDEFNTLADRIKRGETDAYEARSQAKSARVAEAISRGGLGTSASVAKTRTERKAKATAAASATSPLGAARRAEEETKKEKPSSKPSYDVSKRIGSAAKLSQGKPIATQSDFDKTLDEAFETIDKEKKRGGLIPIAALRDAMGDRVSKEDFNKFFGESSLRKGYQSVGGEVSDGTLGYSAKEMYSAEYKTPIGGRRFYLQKQ